MVEISARLEKATLLLEGASRLLASIKVISVRRVATEVRVWQILLKKSASRTKLGWPLRLPAFLGRLRARDWYQFGQLPEVLGSCCEEELVMGTIWSS